MSSETTRNTLATLVRATRNATSAQIVEVPDHIRAGQQVGGYSRGQPKK